MPAIAAGALISFFLATGGPTYEQATMEAGAGGRPILVLVGADWCPACRTMKQRVLPALASRGELSAVNYTTINYDLNPDLAGRLMQGSTIPQLIVYTRRSDGAWHREQITGNASEGEVARLIARAVAVRGPARQEAAPRSANGN